MGRRQECQSVLTAGHALAWNGLWEGAAEHYRRAVVLCPRDAGARAFLAMALVRKGNVEQAWQEMQAAVEIEPQNPLLLRQTAALAVACGKVEQAAEALVGEGERLWETERQPEAVEAWRQAASLAPEAPEAHERLAQAYEEVGDPVLASASAATLDRLQSGATGLIAPEPLPVEQPPAQEPLGEELELAAMAQAAGDAGFAQAFPVKTESVQDALAAPATVSAAEAPPSRAPDYVPPRDAEPAPVAHSDSAAGAESFASTLPAAEDESPLEVPAPFVSTETGRAEPVEPPPSPLVAEEQVQAPATVEPPGVSAGEAQPRQAVAEAPEPVEVSAPGAVVATDVEAPTEEEPRRRWWQGIFSGREGASAGIAPQPEPAREMEPSPVAEVGSEATPGAVPSAASALTEDAAPEDHAEASEAAAADAEAVEEPLALEPAESTAPEAQADEVPVVELTELPAAEVAETPPAATAEAPVAEVSTEPAAEVRDEPAPAGEPGWVIAWVEATRCLREGDLVAALAAQEVAVGAALVQGRAKGAQALPGVDDEALAQLSTVPEARRGPALLGLARGASLAAAGLQAAAAQAYQDAIVAAPEYLPVQVALAELLAATGRAAQAGEKLRAVATVYELRGENEIADRLRMRASAA